MDHFFTAIEEREHPEYRGKPVIVGADPKGGKGRGVVSTSNYEARKFGIRSGMPISRAWKLCPDAVYLPVNFRLYREVRRYADKFEQFGIDEAFLDVSSKGSFEEAKRLAEKIKEEIRRREKLTCSIGIGPSKIVAKIASDFNKPDGLTLIEEKDVASFLSPLPVGKLWGIGRKTEEKLNGIGIKTIGQLASADASKLSRFGVWGKQFHLLARGIDHSEVKERLGVKSISREHTFEEDTSDLNLILKTLDRLGEEVHRDLMNSNLFYKTVTIKIRYENFETHTHSKTLPFITNRLKEIQKVSRGLIKPFLRPNRKIRLVGTRVSNLSSAEKQKTL